MMPVLLLTNATVELYRLYASDPKRHAICPKVASLLRRNSCIQSCTRTRKLLSNHIILTRQVSFPITLFLELYHDLIIMNTFEYPFLTIAHH